MKLNVTNSFLKKKKIICLSFLISLRIITSQQTAEPLELSCYYFSLPTQFTEVLGSESFSKTSYQIK